jgi:hypothetical protein
MGNNVSQQTEKRKARHTQTLSPPQKSSQRFSTSSLAASVGLSKRPPRQDSSIPPSPPPTTIVAVSEPEPQPELQQHGKPPTPPPPPPEKESIPEPISEVRFVLACLTAASRSHLLSFLSSTRCSFHRTTTIRTLTLKEQSCHLNPLPFLARYVLPICHHTYRSEKEGPIYSSSLHYRSFWFSRSDITYLLAAVSHRSDAWKRHLCYRKRGHTHQDRQILCLQSHQQEAHGGKGAHGEHRYAACFVLSRCDVAGGASCS